MLFQIKDSPFISRLVFRYLSLFLAFVHILIFLPFLSGVELAIFFLFKSFHDTLKRLFAGLSGIRYYHKNYIINNHTSENIVTHFYYHFLCSLLAALIVALLIYLDANTYNVFNKFISLTLQDYIFFIIWISTSLSVIPANFIAQIFKYYKLTGFFAVFSSTFLTTIVAFIFYFFSEITLSTFLFSFAIGNLLNFLIVTFFIYRITKIKRIPSAPFHVFVKTANIKESLLGFTNTARWQSILWYLSITNDDRLIIIFGFFNYFFPLIFFPSSAIFSSLRSKFFEIIDSKNSINLKAFINNVTKFNLFYFSIVFIIFLALFLVNLNYNFSDKFAQFEFLKFSDELIYIFLFTFLSLIISVFFFKSLEGTAAGLKKFDAMILINIITIASLLFIVYLFDSNDSIIPWIYAIFISQILRSFLLNIYLVKFLRII